MRGLIQKICCILLICATTPVCANNLPQDLPNKLYELLKPKVEWLDINSKPRQPYEMIIRYFPCFPSVAIMDMLIRQALAEGIPNCVLQNPGILKKEQGYCVLNKVKLRCT